MTTALIVVCILACIGVVLAIVGHLGSGIVFDRIWSRRIVRHHAARKGWSRRRRDATG